MTPVQFSVPRNAWDTHFHVFDAAAHAKPDPKAPYQPMDASPEKLEAMHRRLGIDFGVAVQSAAAEANYGDFIAMLRRHPRLKGVMRYTEAVTDTQIQQLHEAGVRGMRFAFARYMKQPRISRQAFERAIARVRHLGWHVKLHVEGPDLVEIEDWLRPLTVPILIDHAANLRPNEGPDQPGMQLLLDLQRRDNFWVLMANFDRWSEEGRPGFSDAIPLARKLWHNAPDRVIWGTDWPHPMYRNPFKEREPAPDDAQLLNLLGEIAERDQTLLDKILVKNPQALYGKPTT